MIEVTRPLARFDMCRLDKDHLILYPDGRVECPPEHGSWRGELRRLGDGYIIELHTPSGVKQIPTKVYFDDGLTSRRIADLERELEGLRDLLGRFRGELL
jgi:hypothetical protein